MVEEEDDEGREL